MVATKTQVERIKAEGAAYRLAQEYFLDVAEPTPVEEIAMDKDVLCVDAPLKRCLARLIRQGSRGLIRVREGIPQSGWRRFAIAHEMGHWFLHAAYSQYFICTSEDMRDYTKSPLEIEANIFASELLMPTGLFRPLVERVEPRWETISGLSRVFDTSLTSTAIRFIGLNGAECAIAQVERTGIQWLRAKDVKAGLVYRRSGPAHEESLAYHALREKRSIGPEEVKGEAWVSEAFGDRAVTVIEEAAYLERYDTVLSLLSVVDEDSAGADARDELPSVRRRNLRAE